MTDLRTLLELATDEIESPDLARLSLATARRRRPPGDAAWSPRSAAGVAVAGDRRAAAVDVDSTGAASREPTPTPCAGRTR